MSNDITNQLLIAFRKDINHSKSYIMSASISGYLDCVISHHSYKNV